MGVFQAIQLFATVFVASMGLGYSVALFRMRRRQHRLDEVTYDAPLRLKSVSGVYRARFLGRTRGGIRISSPMQRDFFVPLRVGEEIAAEIPIHHAVIVFRTEVIARDSENHTFMLKTPTAPAVVNRREDPRTTRFAGEQVFVNDEWAELIDISKTGARIVSFLGTSTGDVVRVVIPRFEANQLAYVMETLPATIGTRQGYQMRLKFLDPLPPIPLKLKAR